MAKKNILNDVSSFSKAAKLGSMTTFLGDIPVAKFLAEFDIGALQGFFSELLRGCN